MFTQLKGRGWGKRRREREDRKRKRRRQAQKRDQERVDMGKGIKTGERKKKKRCGFSSDVWRVREQKFLFQCKLSKKGDFPAGPVTMTPHSLCRGPRMDT